MAAFDSRKPVQLWIVCYIELLYDGKNPLGSEAKWLIYIYIWIKLERWGSKTRPWQHSHNETFSFSHITDKRFWEKKNKSRFGGFDFSLSIFFFIFFLCLIFAIKSGDHVCLKIQTRRFYNKCMQTFFSFKKQNIADHCKNERKSKKNVKMSLFCWFWLFSAAK